MASNNYNNEKDLAKLLLKLSPDYRGVVYTDRNMNQLRKTITYYFLDGSEVSGNVIYDEMSVKMNFFANEAEKYVVDGGMSGLSAAASENYSSGVSILSATIGYLSGLTSIEWVQESDPNTSVNLTYVGADLEISPRYSDPSKRGDDVYGAGVALPVDTDNPFLNTNYQIFLDHQDQQYSGGNVNPAVDGSERFAVYLHETLHAVGFIDISSASLYTGVNEVYDNKKYTIMSYNGHPQFSTDTQGSFEIPTKVFPTSLMLFDYLALQELGILGSYSPSYQDQLNAGMEITGTGDGYDADTSDDDNAYRWDKDTRVLHTIFDTSGEDTISAAGHDHRAIIDLRQGHFSSYGQKNGIGSSDLPPVENLAIAYGTIVENAVGSNENDVLIGNVYDNNLKGGDGDDFIYGDGFDYDVNEWGLSSSDHESAYASTVGTGYHESSHLQNESGNDTLEGGAGEDTLFGGDGQDILKGDDDEDHL